MKRWITSLAVLLALCLSTQGAWAARAKKAKGKKAKPAKQETVAAEEVKVAITKLMGPYTWGMSSEKVLDTLETDLRDEYTPLIEKEKDALKQDSLRKEMMAKVKELRKSHILFNGKRTPWDVSLIDKEFVHKNEESMVPMWGKMDRRFYFFYNDKLYKLYIAFNSELFKGKTFEDFAGVMEARFGKAERKYSATLMGQPVMDHLAWPPAEQTGMKAIDNTGFYGNFCLVLENVEIAGNVVTARELNTPKARDGSALVEAATEGKEDLSDANEDIVDQITGKRTDLPRGSSDEPAGKGKGKTKGKGKGKNAVDTSAEDVSPAPQPKKRKVSDDPLDGLDI